MVLLEISETKDITETNDDYHLRWQQFHCNVQQPDLSSRETKSISSLLTRYYRPLFHYFCLAQSIVTSILRRDIRSSTSVGRKQPKIYFHL